MRGASFANCELDQFLVESRIERPDAGQSGNDPFTCDWPDGPLYMYIPGEIKPWWEKYSRYWNCKQRNNKLPGFIFQTYGAAIMELGFDFTCTITAMQWLHLLLLGQGVKAHSSGNNKVRLDKVKPTEKWRGGQYLGSEARPLSESASLPRWSPHIIHPTHYRRPRHKLSIHTHHTRSVRYSPIKSQPSFGFLWCTQCADRLKCTIRAAFYSVSKLCTLYTIHRIAETPAPPNQSNSIHTVLRKSFTANCIKDITDPIRNILAGQTLRSEMSRKLTLSDHCLR